MREEILNLPRGSFLYPEKDIIVHFPLFEQHGKPYQIRPLPKQYYTIEPQQKEGIIRRIIKKFKHEREDTEESNIYDDTEKDSDADIEDDALIGEDLFGDDW